VQLEARVGLSYLSSPRFGLVRATVKDQQDLVLFGGDTLLLRERLKTRADECFFVPGRDDYGDLQCRVGCGEGETCGLQGRRAPRSMNSRPSS
jgi:hypothetical protein